MAANVTAHDFATDMQRFHFGKGNGGIGRLGAFGAVARLHLVFIDAGGNHLDRNAGIAQHLLPRSAPRRQDQRRHGGQASAWAASSIARSRCSVSIWMMVAAVSSIERRVTSIISQPCSEQSRRAWAISSRT